ncbi:MAG TPA: hypothetical protein PKE06_06755 [Flavilitoribacter sp.]|nr:hypothetical protein [Flavilitoribacter sp.]
MKKSKLLQLLKSFGRQEWRSFLDFVASPYFNTRKELTELARYLEGRLTGNPADVPDKKAAFGHLFPDLPYDEKMMRYLLSDLFRLAARYLAVRRYEQQERRVQLDQLHCFIDHNQPKAYSRLRDKVEQSISELHLMDDDHYFHLFMLAEIEEHNFTLQKVRRNDPFIQMASDRLDAYFCLKKLKYSCNMLDRQAILQTDYNLTFTDEILGFLERKDFLNQDILRFYGAIFRSLKEENNEAHYFELRRLLRERAGNFSADDLRDIYYLAINFCARKIRKGEEAFAREALELYLDGIERKVLFESGHLSPFAFTNVVKLALRLQRFKWIEEFIRRYSPNLPERFRQNALHYNLAELYYYTRDYDKALEFLNQVKFSDLNYHLGSRVMLAKIYYETREDPALSSLLAAFTLFLKRNRAISDEIKQTYLNFCDILVRILRKDPENRTEIRSVVENTDRLTDRTWLMNILDEAQG